MKVAELVESSIKPIFENFKDIKLVQVEYKKLHDGMHLIIYIDKLTGITIEDCEKVSYAISDYLDDLNPTNDEPYRLDVSSYGLDKPLKYDWQFQKYIGKKVNVSLYKKLNGKKEFVATLVSFNNSEFVFSYNNENLALKSGDVAQLLPYVEF